MFLSKALSETFQFKWQLDCFYRGED